MRLERRVVCFGFGVLAKLEATMRGEERRACGLRSKPGWHEWECEQWRGPHVDEHVSICSVDFENEVNAGNPQGDGGKDGDD